jgi:capsular polysaccharide transport system permease protein
MGVSRNPASLIESVALQLRVISALICRELLTRYGRHNVGFMWMFGEPMLFTLGVTTIWTLTDHHVVSSISITSFVLTGYSTILLWRNMPNRCVGALAPNHSLMFHRQVRPLDVYIARLVIEALGATMSMVSLSAGFLVFHLISVPPDPLLAAEGWFMLAWYSCGLSLLVGAVSEFTELVERVWHIVQYLMIPLSGTFFLVESLPVSLQGLVLMLPTVHCVEMFREGFLGADIVWHYDRFYVVCCNLGLTAVGLLAVRLASKNVRLEY